jgi:hypothetical protein
LRFRFWDFKIRQFFPESLVFSGAAFFGFERAVLILFCLAAAYKFNRSGLFGAKRQD